jgi:hypothetical protein
MAVDRYPAWKVGYRMFDASWAQAVGTATLAGVGLWLAHSYRRQVGLKLVERRIDAYVRLWAVLAPASPGRTAPLDQAERQRLHDEMNRWYFDEGNGILMSTPARNLWVAVSDNLTCPVASIKPPSLAAELAGLTGGEAERRRGCVCVGQASLLRHQMKADLNLHADLYYYPELRAGDRDFLKTCRISPWRHPWRRPLWRARRSARPRATRAYVTELCVCGDCRFATAPPR